MWVLMIAWIGTTYGVHTQEFNSQQACISGQEWIIKTQSQMRGALFAECKPKG